LLWDGMSERHSTAGVTPTSQNHFLSPTSCIRSDRSYRACPTKFIRFDHNGIARASAVILDSETLRVLELCPRGHPARDYASAVGVEDGSD